MAEAAAVATIFGIASFGIQLTQTLYTFGSNVSSAREDASYIARHVDFYANVLDILTERINDEDPILSDAAFDLIDELKYQSTELFHKIEQSLPSPKEGRDDISFLQKVKWNFTKSRVALLVGELDYLRSTVHLLVTIIFTGRKIRSRNKRKVKSSKDNTPDLDNDLRKQGAKAQNALLAHHAALDNLSQLEKVAEGQENFRSQDIKPTSTQQPSTRTDVICTNTTAFAELQQSLAVYTDPTDRQRLVLQRSVHVLQQLLHQWTTVDLSGPEEPSEERQAQSESQQPKTNAASVEPYPLNPSETHDSGYGSATSPRSPDIRRESPPVDSKQNTTTFSAQAWNEKLSENIQNNASASSLPERLKPPMPQQLPPGWIAHVDPATGRNYYIELKTNKTQWEFPSATTSNAAPPERTSTPYASTSGERTVVGERIQSNVPQPAAKKSVELGAAAKTPSAAPPKIELDDLFAQFFGGPISVPDKTRSKSRSKVSNLIACQACNGRGGRADKIATCMNCAGSGERTTIRQMGAMTQRFNSVCSTCNGDGELIRAKYRCAVCNGTKKQPPPRKYRERYDDRYDDRYNDDRPARKSGFDPRNSYGDEPPAAPTGRGYAGRADEDRRPQSSPSGQQQAGGTGGDEGDPGRVQCASQ